VTVASDSFELVTDAAALDAVIARLLQADRYALDTEFHRERTYWPRVALVQVAWPSGEAGPAGVALIDPLAVDLAPLSDVLAGPGTMVAHAAEQDLEVLMQACGRVPTRLFDTQIAAGFVGHGSASLAALSSSFIGVEVVKGDRLTDWSHRPLTAAQLKYAAGDVDHLLELADAVAAELEATGRLSWAEEECEVVRLRSLAEPNPARAWWKLRDARSLRGSSRGVAQSVAAWREQRAQRLDQPLRSILPDLATQAIAHNPPTSLAAVSRIRGLESRYLRPGVAEEILAAVAAGKQLGDAEVELPPTDDVSKDLRPAVALASAWVSQLGRDQRIDAALLATRADLVAYLRHDPTARLRHGWRAVMVGDGLGRLIAGEAALSFDGQGGLVIEARSHRPLEPVVDLSDG
jgi:ribonuclease D